MEVFDTPGSELDRVRVSAGMRVIVSARWMSVVFGVVCSMFECCRCGSLSAASNMSSSVILLTAKHVPGLFPKGAEVFETAGVPKPCTCGPPARGRRGRGFGRSGRAGRLRRATARPALTGHRATGAPPVRPRVSEMS